MTITSQTVFLREAGDEAECARVLAEFYGANYPVTSFVIEPPCDGAALALEAWAIGGKSVRVERHSPQVLTVSYDSVRWVYCAGIKPRAEARGAYSQTLDALEQLRAGLVLAGSSFEQVVRTWFYLGGITEMEGDCQRYLELNRARTDFYHDVRFRCYMMNPGAPKSVYPASTGIGMTGGGLVLGCLALETRRDDLFLLPLENPQQIPAYAYHPKYSPQSPKFSRAVALGLGALLVASPVAFGWLRLTAALYLGWIGVNLLLRPHRPGEAKVDMAGTAFRRGLLTNLLNPKVGVFYVTLLPQFLPPGTGGASAGLALASVHVALTLVWFALLIGFARTLAPLLNSPAFASAIDRVCGVVFIGFGVKLALAKT